MDDKSAEEFKLRELIDAVRPASDDLAHPDFAALARRAMLDPRLRGVCRRSQRLDIAVSDALADLSVPAGSVDRLLAALRAAVPRVGEPLESADSAFTRPADVSAPAPTSAGEVVAHTRAPLPSSIAPTRRAWTASSTLAAAASLALLAYVFWRPAQVEWNPDEIFNDDALITADVEAAQQPLNKMPAPAKYPPGSAVVAQPVGWRPIDNLLGRGGVAYRLRAGRARATLYVIDDFAGRAAPRLVDLPTSPQRNPHQTQGRSMAVWRSGSLVYLLVVQGGAAEYRTFILPAGQLARHSSQRSSARG